MAIFILSFIFFITSENAKAKSQAESKPGATQKHPPIKPIINPKDVSGKVPVPALKIIPASALTNTSVGKPLSKTVPAPAKVGQGGDAHSSNFKKTPKKNNSLSKSTASKNATTFSHEKAEGKNESTKHSPEKSDKTSSRPVKTESKSKMKMRIVAPGEE